MNNMADWAGEQPMLGGKRDRYKTQRRTVEKRRFKTMPRMIVINN